MTTTAINAEEHEVIVLIAAMQMAAEMVILGHYATGIFFVTPPPLLEIAHDAVIGAAGLSKVAL